MFCPEESDGPDKSEGDAIVSGVEIVSASEETTFVSVSVQEIRGAFSVVAARSFPHGRLH